MTRRRSARKGIAREPDFTDQDRVGADGEVAHRRGDRGGNRQRLAQAEIPRQFFRRLHHDPFNTIQTLVSFHIARSQFLQNQNEAPVLNEQTLHTE
jgi:hypothetical protein